MFVEERGIDGVITFIWEEDVIIIGEQGYLSRDYPRKAEFTQGHKQQTQVQQQLVIVDRHIRPTQLGVSGNRYWSRAQSDKTQEVRAAADVVAGML